MDRFKRQHRDNIHQDIHYQIKPYHMNTEIILDRTLEVMKLLLGEKLADILPDELSDVIEFKKKHD